MTTEPACRLRLGLQITGRLRRLEDSHPGAMEMRRISFVLMLSVVLLASQGAWAQDCGRGRQASGDPDVPGRYRPLVRSERRGRWRQTLVRQRLSHGPGLQPGVYEPGVLPDHVLGRSGPPGRGVRLLAHRDAYRSRYPPALRPQQSRERRRAERLPVRPGTVDR